MTSCNRKTLAVIGAGPKGIAVAVKAKVLQEFGIPVDRVVLIEKNGVAAHWSGDFGYTNGEMKLGTSPEKDVVFPLETDSGDPEMNQRIRHRLLQFTWAAFLVQTNRYSDWVDRGRPAPCHQLWACYLRWVSEQLAPEVSILKAKVISVDLSQDESQWELLLENETSVVKVDRLMLTGPGKTRLEMLSETLEDPERKLPERVYDLESFWHALKGKRFLSEGRIAIVGAGENAASALLALSQYAPGLQVDLISPKGFISTRAESFYENQIYSQPDRNHWKLMALSDRKDFVGRTDLGVFSAHAMNILNDQIRHQIVPGRLIRLEKETAGLNLTIEYAEKTTTRIYDQVVLATGFDQVAVLKSLLTEKALRALEKRVGSSLSAEKLSSLIQEDLSVQGMRPVLHLPMLGGLMQGPGFANLSCLGRLSDRVMMRNLRIYFADVSLKTQVEQLRMQEYAGATGFTLDLSTLKWKKSDDESYVLVAEKNGRFVSTMRGEVIGSIDLLEKKLECPWEFPVKIDGPVLLLSRAATSATERASGFNLALRYQFLQFARAHRIRYVIGTFVKGSPRENSMREMGYQLFENSLGWQQSTYRSLVPVAVAVLDMEKDGDRAMKYCRDHLSQDLLAVNPEESFPELRLVGGL
jgi:mycobactin lysine-N-oxygenase